MIKEFLFLVKNSACCCHQLWISQLHVESFKNPGYSGNPVSYLSSQQHIHTDNIQHIIVSCMVLWKVKINSIPYLVCIVILFTYLLNIVCVHVNKFHSVHVLYTGTLYFCIETLIWNSENTSR